MFNAIIGFVIEPQSLDAYTLKLSPRGPAVRRILATALNAVEPGAAVQRALRCEEKALHVAEMAYDLATVQRIFMIALGKASLAMAAALADILDQRLTGGIVITKHLSSLVSFSKDQKKQLERCTILEAGHPIPDERSLVAGQRVLALLESLEAGDLLFCLVSGGGSALMAAPLDDISLADLQVLTTSLMNCGADIHEINTLRRHLDLLKGGGLARLAAPARLVSLVLSDVVGDSLEDIASGPTAPDPSTREQALAVIKRYGLQGKIPASILTALEPGHESLKVGDQIFERVQNVLVGSNLFAAQAALRQAEQEGFHPYLLQVGLQGEAREVAVELCQVLRWVQRRSDPVSPPACLVAGGETTVTVHGDGRGGRNQELALAAVTELANLPDVLLVTLATDGEDGPTDAAGAVVSGETFAHAYELGLDPVAHLKRNDSYTFFNALGDLLRPGPTGTNVNDLVFLFVC